MTWRLARSLEKLRSQINALSPKRSKVSDGAKGDDAHAARKSDHNPNSREYVNALDITHDPKNGVDSYALAKALVANRDPRLSYVISNGKIASREKGWIWRKYTGPNPHNHHVHVSVNQKGETDGSAWSLTGFSAEKAPDAPDVNKTYPLLKRGSTGAAVKELQALLKVDVDGKFGPGTETAVKAFQNARGLHVDGRVGPQTWDALRAPAKPAKAAAPRPAPKPAPAPPAPADASAPVLDASDGLSKAEILQVQTMLRDKGYTEVGNPDGSKGELTDSAVLTFRSENDLPLSTEIDDDFILALLKAGPRKLERNKTTEAEVAAKVPEARVSWFQKLGGYIAGGVLGLIGIVQSALDSLGIAKGYLDPVKEFASDVPSGVWIFAVAIIALGLGVASHYALRKSTEAFQSGARR